MTFLYLLSFLSLILQAVFVTLAIATALYYLAELVEEYTVLAKRVITWLIVLTVTINIGLILFEDLPLHLTIMGLVQQLLHTALMRHFPSVLVTSVEFVTAVVLLVTQHYFTLKYFGAVYHNFSEVLAYFTICLWLVPVALFVSLSANDYVLPTTGEKQPLLADNVVTDYLSKKSKKYSLLSLFSFAKESLLPQRIKKSY